VVTKITGVTKEKLPWYPWLPGRARPFYGWIIVIAGFVGQFIEGILSQGFSTYLGPLQSEFGWSRAILAAPRSVTQINGAILGPLQGSLIDRFGPRLVATVGTFIVGLGLISFGLVHSLWQYYAANIVVDLGFGLAGLLVVSVTINHWFRRRRTAAQSLFLLGYTTAGIIGLPLIVWLQSSFGWRASAIISGVGVWAIGMPASLLLRRDPAPYGLQMDGANSPPISAGSAARTREVVQGFTLRQAMHTRTFWFLSVANGLNGLAQSAMIVHLFLHLEDDVGLSRATAALVWTVASLASVPARLLLGLMGDRLPKHLLYGGSLALIGCGILVLGLASSLPMALLFAVLYGFGWGGRTPLQNALDGEYWGLKSLGRISGTLRSLAVPLSIAGPVFAGVLADARGDYRFVFICVSGASFVAAALVLLASRPHSTEPEGWA
jgi:MFS family permease